MIDANKLRFMLPRDKAEQGAKLLCYSPPITFRKLSTGEWVNEMADCRDTARVRSTQEINQLIRLNQATIVTSNRSGPTRVEIKL